MPPRASCASKKGSHLGVSDMRNTRKAHWAVGIERKTPDLKRCGERKVRSVLQKRKKSRNLLKSHANVSRQSVPTKVLQGGGTGGMQRQSELGLT